MVWGRNKSYAALARHIISSALIAVCVAFPALSILSAAPSGFAAQGEGVYYGAIFGDATLQRVIGNNTIETQAGKRLMRPQPSPYGVDQFFGIAPYRTRAWGTIEQGQKFGVSDRDERYAARGSSDERGIATAPLSAPARPAGAEPADAVGPAPVDEPIPADKSAPVDGPVPADEPAPVDEPDNAAEPTPVKEPDPAPASQGKNRNGAVSAEDGATKKRKVFIRLFGTVDFRSPLKDLPKWERVMQKESTDPSFTEAGLSCGEERTRQRWLELRNSLRDAPLMEKIRGVNNFFNKWPYRTDTVVWGVEDYWASPCEFLARSGDCEDYAIIKFYALKSLGVPAHSMRIAAVRDTIRGIGHAVLAVYTSDDAYVLDNVSNLVLSHKRLKHYRPLFTVNENYLWRHVKPIAGPDSK